MENKHIEQYMNLRNSLTRKEWDELNGLYEYQLHEKERQLTENLTLNDSEIETFRSRAQKLVGITE
ncbi:hypothetical protein [Streptococcus acidominimus]|uniref:Uncharacterized protein n=1 Tax=Streptococcus acidominimus TaxID=1326 RepID=A0A4Y9FQT6_STRAI|nr:hypothetical protein [Streptococcus acidominimus]MBF0818714.1 hypothetical protein [Streptococcus acidominimus]MBF0838343.1 hypothetical protein [Streptococcus acidominimus]MBF0848939.1 hypothetical protein [Streptococcus danieliae]TFU30880.1 hypothetical protein E4U01_04490 [Streptococcus acidominimus]